MPNQPIPYTEALTYPQAYLFTGLSASAMEAQIASGFLTAADPDPETGAPRVTREALSRYLAERAPGGEHHVGRH